jgi:RimJ/RimL family protein N-acetyltransferase
MDDLSTDETAPSGVVIRLLTEEDANAYAELRRDALRQAPLAFASSPGDDLASDPAALREQFRQAPESVIFGAFHRQLVGSIGIYRDRHLKASHKTHIWGMYVTPSSRRMGVASRLLEAALRHAESLSGVSWVHLSVSSAAPEARKLYESLGFRPWGTEPDALRHAGQTVSEFHMALRLA